MKRNRVVSFVGLLGLLAANALASVGTTFTYQGSLLKDNVKVSAVCDAKFLLFDSLIGGSQVGSTQLDTINVNGGLFTSLLNGANEFGANPFTGDERFLVVQVKCPGDADFITLLPRQKLRGAPYAIGLSLPNISTYSTAVNADVFYIANTGDGRALRAYAAKDTAVWAISGGGVAGVDGRNTTGAGVAGTATDALGTGVAGKAPGLGVRGEALGTSNAVGVAGLAQSADCTIGIGGCKGVQGYTQKGYGVEGVVRDTGAGVHGYSEGAGTALKATGQLSGNLIEAWHGPLFPNRKFYVDADGDVFSDGTFNPGGADFAEMLPAIDGLEPGDVLVIGLDGKLARSTRPYETILAGVCSTKPGVLGGAEDGTTLVGKVPLAMVGVVPVKVTAEGGAIRPGDALTTSSTPGHAMRARSVTIGDLTFFPSGVILGKALGTLESGTGTIQALVTLQ